jgi:hypothetical protein
MKCTSCGKKLDMRKKSQYLYESYQLQSRSFLQNLTSKDYWIFCSRGCKGKADVDWYSGNFEEKHGHKIIDFKP